MKDLGKEIELGILEETSDIEEEQQEEEQLENDDKEEEYEAGPDDSVIQPTTESKILEKDWDMMSEIYEKKAN
jgi:hypothetical protein